MNPKPALKQQAPGTGPAEGSRAVNTHHGRPPPCLGKGRAKGSQPSGEGPGYWAGKVVALPFAPRHLSLQKRQRGARGKVPWLNVEGGDEEYFSSTEGWLVCFGKLPKGGGRGVRKGGTEKPGP